MIILRNKMFVSLENIWGNNENTPKRLLKTKLKLTAKNGLNNIGVAKKKIFNPGKSLSLEDKRKIINETNSSLDYLKNLTTKPTETLTRTGAEAVKDTLKSPLRNVITKSIGAGGVIATGNPLAYSPSAEIMAKETIEGVPALKKTISTVDDIIGSKKIADKINPEVVGKSASIIDNTAKTGIKTGVNILKRIFKR